MKSELNEEKCIRLLRLFKHSEYMDNDEDGCGMSCAVVEDVVHEIKRGNDLLIEKVKAIILDSMYDWNVRGSALETLTAAMVPNRCDVLVPILNKIMMDDGDDPSVHHTAIGIYTDLDDVYKYLVRDSMLRMEDYCDHRGRLAREILNAESPLCSDEGEEEFA